MVLDSGRNAHQAIEKARQYMNEGYTWVVDIDLEKYFDTVNHDKLMSLVAREVKDKRVLKLIRAYLNSGVMINGVIVETDKGCPQGGPLSPLLSNVMLDVLDKELEERNHKFCRYADDNQLYVKTRKAAERVMKSITKFIEDKLKLKVNKKKCHRQTLGKKILKILILYKTGRDTDKNPSQDNRKSKGKDKIHYIKKQCLEYGVSLSEIATVNNRMGQLF